MDSSRRNAPSIMANLRVPIRSRRKDAKLARMACETLEGRQLLTGGTAIPGAMTVSGMASPVEIHPVMAQAGTTITSSGATYQIAPSNDIPLPDGQTPPELKASMTTLPLSVTSSGTATALGGIAQGIPFGIAADPSATGGAGLSEAHGDFFATRGGVAMNAAPPMASRMMMPPSDSGQGDSDLAKALQKLKDDQTTINDKSEVTPVLLAAVKADLKAIDTARTTDPDTTLLATLRTDTEALQSAEVPTDELLAKVQADTVAIYLSEGVSQDLIDQWNADQAMVKAASNVTPEDLQLLADDRAAIQTLRDASIQTFRGAPTSEVTTNDDGTSVATTTSLVAAADSSGLAATSDLAASDQAVPPATPPADDGQMATTTIAPVDVKATMTPAPSGSLIKFKGEGQKIKNVKGMIGKARLGKATGMRFLHAGRRGNMRTF